MVIIILVKLRENVERVIYTVVKLIGINKSFTDIFLQKSYLFQGNNYKVTFK